MGEVITTPDIRMLAIDNQREQTKWANMLAWTILIRPWFHDLHIVQCPKFCFSNLVLFNLFLTKINVHYITELVHLHTAFIWFSNLFISHSFLFNLIHLYPCRGTFLACFFPSNSNLIVTCQLEEWSLVEDCFLNIHRSTETGHHKY